MRRMYSKKELEDAIKTTKKNVNTLVDSSGHDRFIEGDIVVPEAQTNITKTYGKWSLSGTHLMLVLAGEIKAASYTDDEVFCEIEIPSWILNKISVIFGNYVDLKSFTIIDSSYASDTQGVNLVKTSSKLQFVQSGNKTLSLPCQFRYSFDLLIDAQ